MTERTPSAVDVWAWTIEHRTLAGSSSRRAPVEVFWLRLPGFLGREGSEGSADCEAIFGEDWETPVLERLLRHDRWWLWWTESSSLRGLMEDAPLVRRSRHLPEALPPDEPAVWLGRGLLDNFGVALLPPRAELHALVLKHGPSLYSEIHPNFVMVLAPSASAPGAGATSPAELQRRLAAATPEVPGLDCLAAVADRLLMQWNGDLYLGARRNEEAALLASLEAWATGYGVRVERSS